MAASSSSSSSSLTLEVTSLSAENLRVDDHSVQKNAFAVVKADPFNYWKTKVDSLGGSYPSWVDEKIAISLPLNAKFFTLQVLYRTSTHRDRLIGTAMVPVSDFLGGYTPQNYMHCLSYRLKDVSGHKNGIINVSVRILNVTPPPPPTTTTTTDGYLLGNNPDQKVKKPDGYKAFLSPEKKSGAVEGCVNGRVVTGFPVGNYYVYNNKGKF